MNKNTLYQIIREDKLLFIARGNPASNPFLDVNTSLTGGNKKRLHELATAIQVHQFVVYFDAACNAVELCVNPDEHRASYAYKQINAFEKRAVCEACEKLRGDYLATKGERPPIREYDFSDKGATNERA